MRIPNTRGFTLIEALTVTGVIAVLILAGIPTYGMIKDHATFGAFADEAVSTLETAHSNAVFSQDGENWWGVRFDETTNEYWLHNESGDVKTITFDEDYSISSADVRFDRLSGTTTEQTVTLDSGSKQKTITIAPTGSVSLK